MLYDLSDIISQKDGPGDGKKKSIKIIDAKRAQVSLVIITIRLLV